MLLPHLFPRFAIDTPVYRVVLAALHRVEKARITRP